MRQPTEDPWMYTVEPFAGDRIPAVIIHDEANSHEIGGTWGNNAEANAQYMAAAPELAAALEGLRRAPNCFCEAGIGNPMAPGHSAACNAAVDALAKAKGDRPRT